MRSKARSRFFWLLICTLLLCLIFPVVASGQGRWYRSRPRTRTVVTYRYYPRPYTFYRTRSYYYRPRVVYATRGYYARPYYGYYPYRYWYTPVHRRHHNRFRVNLRW